MEFRHERRDFREEFAREEAERPHAPRQFVARARMQVDAPHGGLKRRRAARGESRNDA
jgi:hypothetical protein